MFSFLPGLSWRVGLNNYMLGHSLAKICQADVICTRRTTVDSSTEEISSIKAMLCDQKKTFKPLLLHAAWGTSTSESYLTEDVGLVASMSRLMSDPLIYMAAW